MFALTACVTIIFKCRRGILGCLQYMHMKHWGIHQPYMKMKNKPFWIFWTSGTCLLKYTKDGENPTLFPSILFPFRLFVDKMKRWRWFMSHFCALLVLNFPTEGAHGPAPGPADTSACSGCWGLQAGLKIQVSAETIPCPNGRYEAAGVEGEMFCERRCWFLRFLGSFICQQLLFLFNEVS